MGVTGKSVSSEKVPPMLVKHAFFSLGQTTEQLLIPPVCFHGNQYWQEDKSGTDRWKIAYS